MPGDDDLYALLDVDPGASADELREARGFKLRAFHPDRFASAKDRARAEEMTKRVNAAWEVLRDPARRAAYDRARRAGPPGSGGPGALRTDPSDGVRVRRPARAAGPATLSLPCPACGSFRSHLNAGDGAMLRCTRCATGFAALVGASVHHCAVDWSGALPRFDVRYHRSDGSEGRVAFDASTEVELNQHDVFSIVYAPQGSEPEILVNHATADVVRLPAAGPAPRPPFSPWLLLPLAALVGALVLLLAR
jgi:curved DNA-binding protein CbpA